LEAARLVADAFGQCQLAAAVGVSLSELSAVLLGKHRPSPSTLTKLCMAVSCVQRAESEEVKQARSILDEVRQRCQLTGLRRFAKPAGVDLANLARVLKVERNPSTLMLAKLQATLANGP
jgi:hypothetical protein